MNRHIHLPILTHVAARLALAALLACSANTYAAVGADEAALLSSSLTPLGAEKAGNKEGSIPAWTGAPIPYPGYVAGQKRPDPFAADKPLYSITAKNLDQYADKLSDGAKGLFKRYPDTYRIDVYPTRRSGTAPQWVLDNTLKNATRAKLQGYGLTGAYGGIPFPIPKSGLEAMWNHMLRWQGSTVRNEFSGYFTNASGQRVLVGRNSTDVQMPYYMKDGSLEAFDKSGGNHWMISVATLAPPLRTGESIVGYENVDPDKIQTWIYFPGQRRVRKLPNACCDTPNPTTAGQMSFDEIFVWNSRMDRFDWKLMGKKEMLVPYNTNRLMTAAKDEDVLGQRHLNPDHVRWELHRVWIVEATLREGQRHTSPRSRYYLDEDTWTAVLGDRWDANGQLARTLWGMVFAAPDLPGAPLLTFGYNDLLSGAWFAASVNASQTLQFQVLPRIKDAAFTPDALAGEGVR